MIVTCPECGARYRVDETALPAAGRAVRCRSCSHQWRYLPEGSSAEPPPLEPPPPPSFSLPEIASVTPPEANLALATPAEDAVPSESPVVRLVSDRPAAGPAVADPVDRRRLMWGWAALAAAVVLVVAGGAIFRNQLVAIWPPAGRFYAAIGWPAQPSSSLKFSDIKNSWSLDNGQPILVVTGNIMDVSQVVIGVPKLHVLLLGDKQQVLRRIETDPPKQSVRPGETVGFSVNIQDPPREAASVRVAFASP